MKEELITFETAKLAKDKGFNIWCNQRYNYGLRDSSLIGKLEHSPYPPPKGIKIDSNQIFAPTQSLLQKWLREKYDLHITIDKEFTDGDYFIRILIPDKNGKYSNRTRNIKSCKTYEEALEVSLKKSLELIK